MPERTSVRYGSSKPLALALAALALPALAQAAPGYAISGQLGPTVVVENEDYEDDLTFGGSIRSNFGGPGVEFTVLYTQIEGTALDDGDEVDVELDLLSFGLAGRYDVDLDLIDLYGLVGLDLYVNDLSGRAVAVGGGGGAVAVSVDSIDLGLTVGAGVALDFGAIAIGPEVRYRRLLTDNFADDEVLRGTGLDERIGVVSILGRIEYRYR